MNIYIMNPENLDKLAVINDYSARNWNRVWGESGAFKIWAPVTSDNEEFLVEENLVWPDDQLLVGVIENIHKHTEEQSGLPLMEVSGRFVTDSYLSRRIIWGNALLKDTPANIIHTLIKTHAIACTDTSRRFGPAIHTSMTLTSSIPSHSDITYCNSYSNLWEEIKRLDNEYGLNTEFRYYKNGPSIPIITGQPANASAALGSTATFKVTASGTGLFYQWQYQRPNESTWNTVLVNGQEAIFNQTNVQSRHNGFKFRCVISNDSGSVISNEVTLTVASASTSIPIITEQPASVSTALGSTATFKVAVSGSNLSYQWQYQRPNESAWNMAMVNGQEAIFNQTNVQSRHNGFKFRCVISNDSGSVISNEVTLTVASASTSTTLFGVISGGHDRSASVNLSTDLGFLTNSDYLWDSTDYCNTALIAGEGEGADRIIAAIVPDSATQRERRELYVDARDLQKNSASTEDPMSDEEYNSALLQRGYKKLLDHPLYESYECSLQLTGEEGYVFGQDYALGDIVTLTDNVIKVQVQARVKEHLISEDKDGRIDTIVFGLSVPTITSLVKRRD